jgi:AcrR family transcriptional regulator
MAYRRTERESARLAARHDAIIEAARSLASGSGLAAVQIAAVAERAGIAAGTVYRYFPSKEDLVAAVIKNTVDRQVAAIRTAAAASPGALSGLAAALMGVAAETLRTRRLAFALLAETEGDGSAAARERIGGEFETLIRAAVADGQLPAQPSAASASAVLGAMVEGLAGPHVVAALPGAATERAAVLEMTLFTLRALGVADKRARGLVLTARAPA